MKYTDIYLTLSHLFHTIGRLSETAQTVQAALIINGSASRNVLRKIHNQIYLFSYELSQFRYFARVCLECLWIESVNPPL